MEGQHPFIGNPLTYRGGMTMTWQGGRELTGLSRGGVTTAYQYNENSIRTKKTVGASTTEYYLNGNAMIAEKKGNNLITYMFDENGERYGFLYNSTPYYYVRNIQGDVIRILNSAGSVVAKYEYNAWGKVLKVTNASGTVQTSSTFIGNVNPIRYRGYYYDSETGFYYLQSRYYDPETCRFINADDPEMVETCTNRLLSKDLFAYCENNPVMNSDFTGYIAANIVGAVIGAVLGTIGGYVLTNWLANQLGLKGWGRNLFVWGLSAVIGATVGAIGYFLGPYVARAWNTISVRLAGLVKGSYKKIAQITADKMKHINVSKHLWNKVLKKVTNSAIKDLINQAVRKGVWNFDSKGVLQITWKYKGRIIVVTGKIVNGILKIGDAWVKR